MISAERLDRGEKIFDGLSFDFFGLDDFGGGGVVGDLDFEILDAGGDEGVIWFDDFDGGGFGLGWCFDGSFCRCRLGRCGFYGDVGGFFGGFMSRRGNFGVVSG